MRRWILPFTTLIVLLLVAGCANQPTPPPAETPMVVQSTEPTRTPAASQQTGSGSQEPAAAPTPTPGFGLRVSDGKEPEQAPEAVPLAESETLAPAAVEQILNRLDALPTQTADTQEFALPAESLPAPRTGATIEEPFPPVTEAVTPTEVAGAPLAVLRYAPEGDVDIAPYLSVTFNQAMVPLTGLEDLAAKDVPVNLSPQPDGKWRWVGTKTLMFQPTDRFPMATEYTVEVPVGTVSATGGKLAETVSWQFKTPPPALQRSAPNGGPFRLDPLMFVSFDQTVDPEAVIETITIRASGASYAVELATDEEIQADENIRRMVAYAQQGRWLAFRAVKSFPPDTTVTVTVGPGTPSAEGPLTTTSAQSFTFQTYGALRVSESRCGWGSECRPLNGWTIRFTNSLDDAAFDVSMVRVSPELPGMQVNVYGNTISIQGRSSGRTKYTVTLAASIGDQFGQTLGEEKTVAFNVGSAEPTLYAPGGNMIVLDPTGKPVYTVYTINLDRLKVRVMQVQPSDWPAWQEYLRNSYRQGSVVSPPGTQVINQSITVDSEPDVLTETAIDLSPALKAGLGQLVVIVEPETSLLSALLKLRGALPSPLIAWVQSTRIGLDAASDATTMVAWTNSLLDGGAIEGASLSLWPNGAQVTTGQNGIANLVLPSDKVAQLLIAQMGDDLAVLPANTFYWGDSGWQRQSRYDSFLWYVIDDRQIYRPGEEVHIKGWIRTFINGPLGDIGPYSGGSAVSYAVQDSRGNQVLNGSATINALGGFDFKFTLTETMNLGYAYVQFAVSSAGTQNNNFSHSFRVEEFRRPEFEVTTSASEGPYFVGEHATVEVQAAYYAGGPLPNADVDWQITTAAGSYSPPNWSDFTFGTWIPWWNSWKSPGIDIEQGESYTGTTDASGVHVLRLDFDAVNPPRPTVVTAEATVMDVNRQAWSDSTSLLVHPADLYVGMRSERMFVQREDPLKIEAIVTDIDGNAIAGKEISLRAARLAWTYKSGSWSQEEVGVQPCTVISAAEPVSCTFETPEGGTYRITAMIVDDQGRPNQSEFTRWVTGGEQPPARNVEQEEVTLIPDKETYKAGDVAEILVQAPFYPAEGLLTLRRSGLLEKQSITLDGPTTTLRIPIEETYTPNVYVQVDLVGSAQRTDDSGQVQPDLPNRPAYATGSLNLSIPPMARELSVQVTPKDTKLEPGGETSLEIEVQDAEGKPVEGSELAVIVVDESVLALSGYQLSDPTSIFYSDRPSDVSDYHNRASIVLANPADLANAVEATAEELSYSRGLAVPAAAPMAMATQAMEMDAAKSMEFGGGADGSSPIAIRTNFDALAVFSPSVKTDRQGHGTVEVKLPDNLTRYRVMVVGVAGSKQFGMGESAITARLPLMVRPSPPRFLNFGDRFELPIVIQNQTDEPMTVDVAVRASNIELLGAGASRQDDQFTAGQRVIVPANDRMEVRFPATTLTAGTARFQVAATAGKWADAAEFNFPVWTPATTEAFAVYGEIDSGAIDQPVIAPSDVYTQFGGLEITTSSTALQALTDAVLYLTSYPFECSEQLASRILAVSALRDVLTAFKADGLPAPEEIEAAVTQDIERLKNMQNSDGGFPVWTRGKESWPYHTIHVAHALQQAKLKGYDVPADMQSQVLSYLRDIEKRYPSWYSQSTRDTLTAYALNVRKLMGDYDPARARRLIDEKGIDNLSPEAIGWLLSVLSDDAASTNEVDAIRRYLLNHVTETASTAHFAASYGDQGYVLLYSNRRADGIMLDALITDQPDSDLIPKIVRGLLANRTAGRWSNTQENAFILLALDRYFRTYEAETPDFVARIWLGDQYAGESSFEGRTTDYKQVNIPMSYLAEQPGEQSLIVSKEGTGRLYYRLGLRYAPTDLSLEPADYGFTVQRTYEAVDDPDDVTKDVNGVWHVKAGARVRVRVTMLATARRYHVALVDPLPGGFEAMNPALAVTGSVPEDPTGPTPRFGWWWWSPWYQHQNLRDERAEAFTTLLWEGLYNYSYVARATTPGEFVVPPAKAEEMYAPETFGRSGTDRVVIE